MFHKDQTILNIVFVIAGLLLLALYSPWGSPDLYKKNNFYSENQGVNFNYTGIQKQYMHIGSIKGNVGAIKAGISSFSTITNAPKNGDNEIENPEINPEDDYSKRKKNYKISASASGSKTQTASYNAITYLNSSNKIASNQNIASNSGTNFSSGGKSNNSGSSSISTTSNLRTSIRNNTKGDENSSDDLLIYNDSITIQSIDSPQKLNGQNPGDEELFGEPVPIPDGTIILFVSGLIYILFKQRKLLIMKLRTLTK